MFKYDAIALSAEDLKVGVGEAIAQFLNNLGEPTKIVAANVVPAAGFETTIRPSTDRRGRPGQARASPRSSTPRRSPS